MNENDKELVVMLADGHRGLPWAFLREYALLKYGLDGFLVEPDQPIPIPPQGAVLIGDGNNDSRDTLFMDGETLELDITTITKANLFVDGLTGDSGK